MGRYLLSYDKNRTAWSEKNVFITATNIQQAREKAAKFLYRRDPGFNPETLLSKIDIVEVQQRITPPKTKILIDRNINGHGSKYCLFTADEQNAYGIADDLDSALCDLIKMLHYSSGPLCLVDDVEDIEFELPESLNFCQICDEEKTAYLTSGEFDKESFDGYCCEQCKEYQL